MVLLGDAPRARQVRVGTERVAGRAESAAEVDRCPRDLGSGMPAREQMFASAHNHLTGWDVPAGAYA
jgi:hypothetical protein